LNLLIVHISDIHFTLSTNPVLAHAERLLEAVRSVSVGITECIVAVTGDVAFSGDKGEYEIAAEFLSKIMTAIRTTIPHVEMFVIPGNHDCNFTRQSAVRQVLIDQKEVLASVRPSPDESVVENCTTVQDDFFNFLHSIDGTADSSIIGAGRLFSTRSFTTGGGSTILVACYNTAWVSRLHEVQGQLVYPVAVAALPEGEFCFVLSLLHHPFNWLEAENARLFRHHVEQGSDLILTGHEHTPDTYTKKTLSGATPTYLEGAVLQENGAPAGGFMSVLVDLSARRMRQSVFSWNGSEYHRQTADWQEFTRSRLLRRGAWENTPSFAAFLDDAGASFTHPRIDVVKLHHIFIYPDLEEMTIQPGPRVALPELRSGSELI